MIGITKERIEALRDRILAVENEIENFNADFPELVSLEDNYCEMKFTSSTMKLSYADRMLRELERKLFPVEGEGLDDSGSDSKG